MCAFENVKNRSWSRSEASGHFALQDALLTAHFVSNLRNSSHCVCIRKEATPILTLIPHSRLTFISKTHTTFHRPISGRPHFGGADSRAPPPGGHRLRGHPPPRAHGRLPPTAVPGQVNSPSSHYIFDLILFVLYECLGRLSSGPA
jgi:hypothetical protein